MPPAPALEPALPPMPAAENDPLAPALGVEIPGGASRSELAGKHEARASVLASTQAPANAPRWCAIEDRFAISLPAVGRLSTAQNTLSGALIKCADPSIDQSSSLGVGQGATYRGHAHTGDRCVHPKRNHRELGRARFQEFRTGDPEASFARLHVANEHLRERRLEAKVERDLGRTARPMT